jgi:cation:H+ antiporter
MLFEGMLFVGGLAVLVAGADRLIQGAGELALYYGLSAFFVGVTVVSVGTSVPEMTTSVYGAWYGAGDMVVGNIVGSEVAQITLGVGIVALIAPIRARRRQTLIYGGGMILAMVIMVLTLEDGVVVRSEGVLMMLAYVVFVHDLYSNEGGEEVTGEVLEERREPRETVPWIVIGLVLVVGGGHVMVTNGVELARMAGIPEFFLGVLTGLGTTAPELVVAGLAAHRGAGGISVGALLGSNITDPVFSLGVGALVADVAVTDPLLTRSTTYMLLASLAVLGVMVWRRGISRPVAVGCVLLYVPSLLLY